MDQREVWERIAPEWSRFRIHPRTEAVEFLQNRKGLVLDLGCANGRNFIPIGGTIVGTDFSEKMLMHAKKHAKEAGALLVRGDATDLPFSDSVFDAVLFANALPSIKYNRHRKVLSEIARVSKNRADVFVSVWNRDQPRFAGVKKETTIPWKTGSDRYYYLYSRDELKALMSKHFSNVRVLGSREKAFKKFPKNIIAVARVAKKPLSLRKRKALGFNSRKPEAF